MPYIMIRGERKWVDNFQPASEPLNPEQAAKQLQEEVTQATQKRLDDFAQTKTYDSILSACTYATSAVPRLQTEGQYCVESRDNTWETLYTILGEVAAGTQPYLL